MDNPYKEKINKKTGYISLLPTNGEEETVLDKCARWVAEWFCNNPKCILDNDPGVDPTEDHNTWTLHGKSDIYTVTYDEESQSVFCSCPHGPYGGLCRHIARLYYYGKSHKQNAALFHVVQWVEYMDHKDYERRCDGPSDEEISFGYIE